jgi:hypothetical protein
MCKASVHRGAVVERHPRVTTPTGIEGNISIRKFNELQVPILVLDQNHPNIGAVGVRIPLDVLTCRDFPAAHVTGSDEIGNHDLLDGASLKTVVQSRAYEVVPHFLSDFLSFRRLRPCL